MGNKFARDISFERTFVNVEGYGMVGFDRSGKVRFWNKGADLLYGYSAAEAEGMPVERLNSVDHFNARYMEMLAEKNSITEECWQKRRDGSFFWAKVMTAAIFEEPDTVTGYIQIVQDISIVGVGLTVGAQDFFGDTVSDILDYSVLLLDKDGIIQYVSKASERIKRYKQENLMGRHIRIFYSKEDREEGLPDKLMAVAEAEGKVHYEGWRIRGDGTRFWASVLLTALKGWDGKVIGYYKITRDITERKDAREVQERHTEFLERHNKEVEELAYISSHDLKEPIRTIISFLDLFREQYEPVADETGMAYIDVIYQCTERMQELVNAILQYSLIGAQPNIGFVDMNVLLRDVENDLYESIHSTGTVVNKDYLPSIVGYKVELRQLIQNLISNAIKFRKKDVPLVISVSASFEYPEWIFVVADNGIGFNAKFAERIFQLFQRLHRSQEYEGSGVGLSYAKKIVGLHKGRIWAESTVGEGSRFCFTIPQYNNHEG